MCLSGIAHFLLSNMRSRGGQSDGVRKQAVCTLAGEGEKLQGSDNAWARKPGAWSQAPSQWGTESTLSVSLQTGTSCWKTPLGPFSLTTFGRRHIQRCCSRSSWLCVLSRLWAQTPLASVEHSHQASLVFHSRGWGWLFRKGQMHFATVFWSPDCSL